MKQKKDCKECGAPLENWQVKQGYDLCLECYNSKKTTIRKTSHELLQDKSTEEEEGEIEEKNEHKRKETRDEMKEEEEVEENLGETNEHSEDEEQDEEEE